MAMTEVSYSAFLRGPGEVLPALDHGDVLLDRRDGEPLVLSRARRYRSGLQGVALTARIIRNLVKEHTELAESLLEAELPWIRWMPRSEQIDCVSEILANLAAGADTGTFEPFARSLSEWEHTAEVWADPDLAKRLSAEFRGDGDEITRPKARR